MSVRIKVITWSGQPDSNRGPLRPEANSADMPLGLGEAESGSPPYLPKRSEWVALSRPGAKHFGPRWHPTGSRSALTPLTASGGQPLEATIHPPGISDRPRD